MSTNELLSVIIPVYNGEKYIKQTLDSVMQQSYTNLEILVVNDGSLDSTKEIVETAMNQDKRIRLHSIPNGGVSNARNYGLDHVSGEYVAFLDADDLLQRECYRIMMEEMVGGGYDAVAVCFRTFIDEVEINITPSQNGRKVFNGSHQILASLYSEIKDDSVRGYVWNKVYRKASIAGLRFDTNLQMCEDSVWSAKFFFNAKSICLIKQPMYFYRIYQESSTRSAKAEKKYQAVRAYEILLEMSRDSDDKLYEHYVKEYLQWNMNVCNVLKLSSDRSVYEAVKANLKAYADEPYLMQMNTYNRIKFQAAKTNLYIFLLVRSIFDFYTNMKKRLKRSKEAI